MRPSALFFFVPSIVLLSVLLGSSPAVAAPGADAFTQALGRGPIYAAIAALLGGLLVSLTPCVYPMVAVTVSVFGARQTKSRAEGALLSAAFVGGIVAMFVPLGVAAALTGTVFGAVLQNQWVITAISVLFLVMALSMFGAFELALPSSLTNRLAQVGGLGFRGAFVLGLACGLIASPCTGPVLTGILAWIAQSRDPWLGGAAMAAFALGLGVPFFVVGTFAVQLPKSGRWMVHVKSLLGIVLVVVALYFWSTTTPWLTAVVEPNLKVMGIAAAVVVVGLLLGAIHGDFASPSWAQRLRKGAGVVFVSVGAFVLVVGLSKPTRSLAWDELPLASALERSKAEGRPLLVDFTAAWCGACKELDKLTFSDESVMREGGRFVAVKVDATDGEPAVEATMARHRVLGLPTVIVFDSQGREALRFTEFVTAGQLVEALAGVD